MILISTYARLIVLSDICCTPIPQLLKTKLTRFMVIEVFVYAVEAVGVTIFTNCKP